MKCALATLALVSFVSASHAKDFGEGWDMKNGHQRMAEVIAYLNYAGLVCPKPPAEYENWEDQEQFLAEYVPAWSTVLVYVGTYCSVRVATIQASAHIAREPPLALKKPPVAVAKKPKAKEGAPWPLSPWSALSPWPEIPQTVEPEKETRVQMLIHWAQELWHWHTTKPAS